jgi:hypothetical protein
MVAVPASLPGTTTWCRIDLEGFESAVADALRSDTGSGAFRRAFIRMAQRLVGLVDDPSTVTLVIPLDVAQAVSERQDGAAYTRQRGSGLVVGRTMTRPDVLIDANPIARPVGNAWVWDDFGLQLDERTLVHEAPHVIMAQRGSGFEAYGYQDVDDHLSRMLVGLRGQGLRRTPRRVQCGAAHPLDEPADDRRRRSGARGPRAGASRGRGAFAQTQDVEQLFLAMLGACNSFWTLLAYWSAQWRRGDVLGAAPKDIAGLELWRRNVGDFWTDLATAVAGTRGRLDDTAGRPASRGTAGRRRATALTAPSTSDERRLLRGRLLHRTLGSPVGLSPPPGAPLSAGGAHSHPGLMRTVSLAGPPKLAP